MLLSRTRWFPPDSPVGIWWLAHCQGFRVEPPPRHGPPGTVEDVAHVQVGGRAELLIVRVDRGHGRVTTPRPIAVSEVAGIDPGKRVVLLRTSLRRAARHAKSSARRLGWSRELHLAR